MKLVPKFWRSWSWLVAWLGIALPEVLQLIASNTSLIPFLPPEWQGFIRLVALVLVVLLRPVKQSSMDD